MDVPDVRYARAGGVAIAYQVVGDGPRTLLLSPQISDLLTLWLSRDTSSFLRRLAAHVRVVVLNPRGTGLSDRPRNVTLEARMDDLTAVLDHAHIDAVTLMGISTSANVCALFAASHPDRVERLVLADPFPRGIPSDDYPWGFDEGGWLSWIRELREHWGERDFMERFGRQMAQSEIAGDPDELDLFVWRGRLSLSPTAAADWSRMAMETDIVDILSSIRVPTLVLHRADAADTTGGVGPARFVAERIRDARTMAGDVFSEGSADAILEFVRGGAHVAVPDSVLATVLFTDLVGSTEQAATLGDRAWRDVLSRHHADVRREVVLYRGIEVDSAGDGSSAASTVRRERWSAPVRSSGGRRSSISTSAPVSTLASASSSATRSPASRS